VAESCARPVVDGRAIPREEITGVAIAPRTRVTVSREGAAQRSSRGSEVFLLLRTRVVRVLDAPDEAVQKVAASLSSLLALGAARTLLPEVRYQFRFDPRSPQGRARAANVMQRDRRAPTASAYYGGMRVLGALLAVYLCSLPALAVFASLSGEPWSLTPRAGLMSLGGFWLSDALAVVVWGACFRQPMQDYARERFGVATAKRSSRDLCRWTSRSVLTALAAPDDTRERGSHRRGAARAPRRAASARCDRRQRDWRSWIHTRGRARSVIRIAGPGAHDERRVPTGAVPRPIGLASRGAGMLGRSEGDTKSVSEISQSSLGSER
jgi:hypothetical protein